MKTTRWFVLCSLAAMFYVFGCSSGSPSPGGTTTNESPGDDDGGSGGASSGVGSSGGSTSGTASSSGTSTSSGASSGVSSGSGTSSSGASSGGSMTPGDGGLSMTDGAPQNDPEIDYSVAPVTLTMTQFTVAPNQEVYYCQNFANPWGKTVDIKTYDLSMGVGSHHMFAFYQSNATNGALGPCPEGGLEFGAFTFVSQSAKKTVNFPATVGATIPQSTGFQLMVHYLNTSSSTLTSSVALTMYVAKAGVVTQHAGVLYLNNVGLTVPASCTTGCPSTDSYTLTQDVNILSTEGHMHKYGTDFVTTVSPAPAALPSGQMYQTKQWDEPQQQEFATPLHLASGTKVTWTCTDVNNTGGLLTFGQSAVSNVMCISQSIFYPVQDVNDPVLGIGGGGL